MRIGKNNAPGVDDDTASGRRADTASRVGGAKDIDERFSGE